MPTTWSRPSPADDRADGDSDREVERRARQAWFSGLQLGSLLLGIWRSLSSMLVVTADSDRGRLWSNSSMISGN
jgi:hypothetical protein